MTPAEQERAALALADAYVLSDIECFGHPACHADGITWYDVAHMLNPQEHSTQAQEMWRQALAYAAARRLIARHPDCAHLVRITNRLH